MRQALQHVQPYFSQLVARSSFAQAAIDGHLASLCVHQATPCLIKNKGDSGPFHVIALQAIRAMTRARW